MHSNEGAFPVLEDPVCRRLIRLNDTTVLRREQAEGQAFFFCSSDCAQRFRLMQQTNGFGAPGGQRL